MMEGRRAIMTVELVDESVKEAGKKITRELLDWFQEEAIAISWVKNVKEITREKVIAKVASKVPRNNQ